MPDVLYALGDPTDYSLAAGTRLKDGITFMLDGNPLMDFSIEPEGFVGRDDDGRVDFGESAGPVRTNAGRVDVVSLDVVNNAMAMCILPKSITGDFDLWFTLNRTFSSANPLIAVGLSNKEYQYDVNSRTNPARSLIGGDVRASANSILMWDRSTLLRSLQVLVAGVQTAGVTQIVADGVTKYMSIARVGTTVTAKQYPTSADRSADTNADWTDTLTGPADTLTHLYFLAPWNAAVGSRIWSGWVDDFQFASDTYVTTTPFVTGPVLNITDTLAAADALAIEESTPAGSSIQHEYNIDSGGWQTAGTPVADGSSNIVEVAAALANQGISSSIQLRHGLISAGGQVTPEIVIVPSSMLGTLAGGGGGDTTRSRFARPLGVKGRVAT